MRKRNVTSAINRERDVIADHLFRDSEDCRKLSRETEGEISIRYTLLADELARQARVVRGGKRSAPTPEPVREGKGVKE